MAPIFTMPALELVENALALSANNNQPSLIPQYGLLASLSDSLVETTSATDTDAEDDPRASGKSHKLSCLLGNCLMSSSDAIMLENPLSGLVFHYDTFMSDTKGSPCKAAFLSSCRDINVRVLCSPANIRSIRETYSNLPNILIEPLQISSRHLNTKRMLDFMAVSQDNGSMPLYLHTVVRILRDMRIEQQSNLAGAASIFNYRRFKEKVLGAQLSAVQLGPLNQRLDMLESFMPKSETADQAGKNKSKKKGEKEGNEWDCKAGQLTIIDLSCPCVTSEGACALFNICLSIFLDHQDGNIGRVVALDEAHKYMNASLEASTLTHTLLNIIRLQRHLGTRVLISTQEPTVAPQLLDLSSVTIVHRFSSPEWLKTLNRHLAGAKNKSSMFNREGYEDDDVVDDRGEELFEEIVKLRVGEAFLFAPSAVLGVVGSGNEAVVKRLGNGFVKIQVRERLTKDGGVSVMAG